MSARTALPGTPAMERTIAAMVAWRGFRYLDMPVSGRTTGAAGGQLTIVVRGWVQDHVGAEPVPQGGS